MISAHYDWQIKRVDQPGETAKALASELSLDPMVTQILVNRGYDTTETITRFLKPDLSQLHDPFSMHDMQKGVDRIQEAIVAGDQITIYGDYDADGVTSTAILYDTLNQIGADVNYFIPNRFVDGYGPNVDAFERLIKTGTKLIVTCDNGVSGHDAIQRATDLGVDVVVTDHHELPETLPDACAVIHPRHPEGDYPFGGLSGAGVAFKVATAILDEVPQELLDLAAIGTVADLVPLVDENRVLVTAGLQLMKQTDRFGLIALIKGAGIDPGQLDEQSIGFGIAPRLNALGRLDDAAPAVELLTTGDDQRAEQLAELTEKQNQYRQKLVADISDVALVQAQDEQHRDHPALIITGTGWHEGVLGIVASKVVEATGKPTVVLDVKTDHGTAKGSGRSVEGFNLFEAFDSHRDMLVNFGGHAAAVGMTAKADQLIELQAAFDQAAEDQHLTDQPKVQLPIATQLTTTQVTMPLYEQLRQLAPFGTDNPVPLFVFQPEQVQNVKAIGADGKHLKFQLTDAGQTLDAIDFGQGALTPALQSAADQVQLVAQIDVNVWQGRTSLQLMIKDIAISGIVVEDQRTQSLRRSMFADSKGTYVFFNERLYKQLQPQLPPTAASWLLSDADRLTNQHATTLYLVDCPATLADLQTALTAISADQIVAYFYLKESHYLLGMPDRAEYAKLFKFVQTHQNVDVGHRLGELTTYLQLKMPQLVLMLQIFTELKFITIEHGVMNPVASPAHQAIERAPSYEQRQTQIETEKQLLYSETADLKQLISSYLESE